MDRTPALALVLAIVLSTPAWADPTDSLLTSDPAQFPSLVKRQRALVEADTGRDALRLVELGSIAMAADDREGAFRAFDRAADIMLDFESVGNFRARDPFRNEVSKEWKGEGYEKLAAFTYLGMLYIQRGEVGNGLAMLKTASIADAGTENQRFKGDFVPAYAIRAWMLDHMGPQEAENAEAARADVRTALFNRYVVEAAGRACPTAAGELDRKRFDLVEQLVLDGLATTLVDRIDEPNHALFGAVQSARAKAIQLLERKRVNRPGQYRQLKKRDLKSFPKVQTLWLDNLERTLPDAQRNANTRLAAVLGTIADKPNVLFVVERGTAPEKTTVALFGSRLAYNVGDEGPDTLEAQLDDQPMLLQWTDSLGFQATSRGGRKMDELNRGKANARAGFYAAAGAAAAVAVASEDTTVKVGAALVGVLALGMGSSIRPGADTRDWRSLPNDFYIGSAQLPPGEHQVRVGRRVVTFTVGDGPTLVHVPVRYVHQAELIDDTAIASAKHENASGPEAQGASLAWPAIRITMSPNDIVASRLVGWLALADAYARQGDPLVIAAQCAALHASFPLGSDTALDTVVADGATYTPKTRAMAAAALKFCPAGPGADQE